jgi:hypothetical protein
MAEIFELYEIVIIKSQNIPGTIVSIDTDGGTKPPIYFVEKDDAYKNGKNDLVWCEGEEISKA